MTIGQANVGRRGCLWLGVSREIAMRGTSLYRFFFKVESASTGESSSITRGFIIS